MVIRLFRGGINDEEGNYICGAFFWMAALCGSLISPALDRKSFSKATIRIIVGFTAGDGFDAHSRAIDRHMSKHIPGSPLILVENMAGAGSMIAAIYVCNQAKPDGLIIGNWIGGLILQQSARRQRNRLRCGEVRMGRRSCTYQ
jgi:tripartite-type tricarboxylate transporter receptor subunit TctC